MLETCPRSETCPYFRNYFLYHYWILPVIYIFTPYKTFKSRASFRLFDFHITTGYLESNICCARLTDNDSVEVGEGVEAGRGNVGTGKL